VNIVEIVVFEMGWVSLSANFRGNGVAHQRLLASEKYRVPGLSRVIVCLILCWVVLIQYRHVTGRKTHTQTRRRQLIPALA